MYIFGVAWAEGWFVYWLCTDSSNYFLYPVCAAMSVLSVFACMSENRCRICWQSRFSDTGRNASCRRVIGRSCMVGPTASQVSNWLKEVIPLHRCTCRLYAEVSGWTNKSQTDWCLFTYRRNFGIIVLFFAQFDRFLAVETLWPSVAWCPSPRQWTMSDLYAYSFSRHCESIPVPSARLNIQCNAKWSMWTFNWIPSG